MKKVRKILSLILAVAMVLTALAGCASGGSGKDASKAESGAETDTPDIDLSKEAELSLYLIGSSTAAYDKAIEEMNKNLKEDMNTTVKVSFIGWGDFGTKYPLILSSGEAIDLVYASGWTGFKTQAQKGAFMPLEELAPKYAPKSYAEMNEDWIEQATIDGHMYGFPAEFYQYNCMGYIVRGDLMEKYNMTEIKNMDDYGEYLANVVANDPELDPAGFMATSDGLMETFAGEMGWYNLSQNPQTPFYTEFSSTENPQVFFLYDKPEMKDFFIKMKDWSDKGYWLKSALSNKDENLMLNGKAASRIHGLDTWKGMVMKHPEYNAKWFPARPYVFKTEAMQDGMAVPASAKNPERALMFLEKLRQEEKYYNYMTYGIEGETYEVLENGQLKPLDMENYAPENFCSWGFKEFKFIKDVEGTPAELKDYNAMLAEKCEENVFIQFHFDSDPVKSEFAAVTNVYQQYAIPLAYGYVDDPVAGFDTLMEKMKAAGYEKVRDEMQKQLDEYMATRK